MKEKIVVSGFVSAIVNGNEEIPGIKALAEDAVKECETGYQNKIPFAGQYENSITCDMPDKLYMISKCIIGFIFKNCPQFKAGHGCDELKKEMEHCEEYSTTIATIPPPPTVPPATLPPTTVPPPTEPPTTTTILVTTTIVEETSTLVTGGSSLEQGSTTQVPGT